MGDRFWWMLRWLGFDNTSVLDGGYDNWVAERRAVSTGQPDYPAGKLSIDLRPGLFVTKNEVLAAIEDPATSTVHALGTDVYSEGTYAMGDPAGFRAA